MINTQSPSITPYQPEHGLFISHNVAAPLALAYAAWSDEQHFARWFGPHGAELPVCRINPQTNGIIHFCHRIPEMGDLWILGKFIEVIPMQRLEFSLQFVDATNKPIIHPMLPDWPIDTHIITAVDFLEIDAEHTQLNITQTIEPRANAGLPIVIQERELATMGWIETLERFDYFLNSAQASQHA